MTGPMERIVVVGGSIAALTAAATLRAEGFAGRLTMLSDESRRPYTRVPLSKAVLAGRRDADDISLPVPDDVELRLDTPARGLDLASRTVLTDIGSLHYDGLVLATGARARRVGDGGGDLVLRTDHDGARLREEIGRARSVLVVGGGFLGMEIASTCCELGKEVTLVDLVRPLERLLGEHVATIVAEAAARAGVRILAGEQRPQADLVVQAVGDQPNTEWLAGSGLRLHQGAVAVGSDGSVAPGVVAAGDVAALRTPTGWVRTPSWTNAVEQARHSALVLLHGQDVPRYRPSGYFWTEQFGLDIKLVGALGPRGRPDRVDEAGDGRLMTWSTGTVIAVDHPIRVALLKRQLGQGALAR